MTTWVDTGSSREGANKRDMNDSYLSYWENGRYVIIYPTTEALDKMNHTDIFTQTLKDRSGKVSKIRYRKARPDEKMRTVLRNSREDERPHYDLYNSISDKIECEDSPRTKTNEEFEEEWVIVHVPSNWNWR
jgi:hypothetical protein